MTGQYKPKGGIASFSIGLGKDETPHAVPVSSAPPYRVLIAGDFGLPASDAALNITGLDAAELLGPNNPAFTVKAENLLGSHPAELEERISLSTFEDLRPSQMCQAFRFVRDVNFAVGDENELAAQGPLYDKLVEAMRADRQPAGQAAKSDPGPAVNEESGTPGGPKDPASLFSMFDTPGKPRQETDGGSAAKAAVDAFVQRTLQEEKQATLKPASAADEPAATGLLKAQSALFFEDARLKTVLQNWHSLNLLLSEITFNLPLELHLLQLDHDVSTGNLEELLGGAADALQAELYDVVLFANPVGLAGQDIDKVKVIAHECERSDTVGFVVLEPLFSGMPGEQLAATDAAPQLFEQPGFEDFQGLRQSDSASHLALFWNEARLSGGGEGYPAIFIPAAWIALAEVLTQLETEVFPRLPVGEPVDFDALEIAESRSQDRVVATAARFLAGPEAAPSLAQCGINVLEGVANRTDLLFRRGVTVRPGKEGRGSIDQALLVSRLFSLFQEALGGAVMPGQSAEAREAAVRENLEVLSTSLAGEVSFHVQRITAENQDLINVSASVLGGWASGQQHAFYLPSA